MNLEKLMQKKISRKDFMKSIGFILLALVFFPKKALSFIEEEKETKNNPDGSVTINGIKVIELIKD
jgi:hypothetical protein